MLTRTLGFDTAGVLAYSAGGAEGRLEERWCREFSPTLATVGLVRVDLLGSMGLPAHPFASAREVYVRLSVARSEGAFSGSLHAVLHRAAGKDTGSGRAPVSLDENIQNLRPCLAEEGVLPELGAHVVLVQTR